MKRKWILFFLRMAIGFVFIYAGFLKIKDPQALADSIATFRLLPKELIMIISLSLPPFEIIVGSFLILGRYQRVGALGIFLMTAMFALALTQGIVRGLEIDCGCFGGGTPSPWKTSLSLVRDLALMTGAGFVYFYLTRQTFDKTGEGLEKI